MNHSGFSTFIPYCIPFINRELCIQISFKIKSVELTSPNRSTDSVKLNDVSIVNKNKKQNTKHSQYIDVYYSFTVL